MRTPPPLSQLRMDIAASLYILPGTTEELRERDFLKNIAMEGVEMALAYMERRNWSYERSGKIFIKKWVVRDILNYYGYELEV